MKKMITKLTSGVLLCTMLTYTTPLFAFTKDETVYSKLDSNGNVYNTIVSEHIKNTEEASLINDVSDLLNLTNVGGDETFKQDGTNIVWNANGKDIYYQGETKKELPIKCEVKYELNGEEISSEEIAGKSGKVKIILTYTNTDAHKVNINGKTETMYTPFVVICGTVINNDTNRNIKITNGKTIDNGNKTIVAGISLPGLQESLGISKSTLEIPNTIEISMDTTNFEMSNIMSYATSKVIEDEDFTFLNNLDKIYSQVNTLQTASKQLETGSSLLKDSSMIYSDKSKQFNSALKQMSKGITSANSSYTEINSAINLINKNCSSLQDGAKALSDGVKLASSGLTSLSTGSATLQDGIDELKNNKTLISDGLTAISNMGMGNLNLSDKTSTINGLNTSLANTTTMRDNLLVQNSSLQNQLTIGGLTPDQVTDINNQITLNNNYIAVLNSNIQIIQSQLTIISATDISTMQNLQSSLTSLQGGLQALDGGLDKIYNGAQGLQAGTTLLASNATTLVSGAEALYEGTTELATGVDTLNSYSAQMKKGLSTLDYSSNQLVSANNQLTDGASALANGVQTLSDGITQFDKDGIQKICNYINGNLKDVSVRLEKLQALSEEYNSFTMLDDKNDGVVKFIMIIDSVKKDEDKKQEIIIENKNEEKDN